MSHSPTTEQTSILDFASSSSDNLLINAYAGTGKTSTLELLEGVIGGPILYLVFNAKNKEEAEGRMSSTTICRTMNGLGHRVLMQMVSGKIGKPDGKKCATILREMIKSVKNRGVENEMWEVFWNVVDGVARAKALGYIPEGKFDHAKRLLSRSEFHKTLEEDPDDLTADLIDAVLLKSIVAAYKGDIDWNDQVYIPALFGGKFPTYPTLLIDEYQDLNPVNHVMIDKLMRGSTRLFGVGDECQNIYGFRGAKAQGMRDARERFNMSRSELSISFRCPKAIVKHVHWRVPQFKWFKDGGNVSTPIRINHRDILDDAAIICRNNAPLFAVGLRLLAAGRGVTIAGSDIGPKIVGIMKKLGGYDDCTQSQLLGAIEDWLADKLAKESTTAQDLADCMKVFASFGTSKSQAILYAEHLFSQKGTIQLMTGHKAKGLEFDNVYHLDPHLCKDTQQDKNVRYVISTRSAENLTEIHSQGIEW